MASTGPRRGCRAGWPCSSDALGNLPATGAQRSSRTLGSLSRDLLLVPLPRFLRKLCIFRERASRLCGPRSVLAATPGRRCRDRKEDAPLGPQRGLGTWDPEGLVQVTILRKKKLKCQLGGGDRNNNTINNNSGHLVKGVCLCLGTKSRAEAPATQNHVPRPTCLEGLGRALSRLMPREGDGLAAGCGEYEWLIRVTCAALAKAGVPHGRPRSRALT